MVVCCGKIIALGKKSNEFSSLNIDHVYDLEQKTVLPAFGDAHLHFLWMARRFFEADLSGTRSPNEVFERLTDFAHSEYADTEWLVGRGFNKNLWPDFRPHRKYLDTLFPDRPVFLQSQDCHSAWVNTQALRRAHIHSQTKNPSGGYIEKDNAGEPTGLLYDQAASMVSAHIPEPNTARLNSAAIRLIRQLHAFGITRIHSMGNTDAFTFWQSFHQKHPNSLRVTLYFQQSEIETLIAAGLRSGFGSRWLRIGGIKFFSDGSLGSQTALLSHPYRGSDNHYGLALLEQKELNERIRRAECHGLAVAVHAIGDHAVERVLKALKQSEPCRKKQHLISRIEHAQLIRADLLPLFRQYGLVASVQPIHIADDIPLAEKYWGTRSRWAFAFHSLLGTGIPLAFGSDAPVAEPDPVKGIFSAVNRRYRFSIEQPVWYPQESLNTVEAFKAFTFGSALAGNEHKATGTLEVGKDADFIVMNKDPFSLPESDLLSVAVERTYLAGECVYTASHADE